MNAETSELTIEIILPFYNGSKFIQSQLDSIEQQSVPEDMSLKILLIDDASAESERQFIEALCQNRPHIKLTRNPANMGVIPSVERGLQLSTAPYVMFSDQDDFWLPGKIEKTYQKMREIELKGPALVFADLQVADANLRPIPGKTMFDLNRLQNDFKNSLLLKNKVTGGTMMLNRQLVELALPFPPSALMHDYWVGLCAAFGGQIAALHEPLVLYRQHSSNQVGAPKSQLKKYLIRWQQSLDHLDQNLRQKTLQIEDLQERLCSRGLTHSNELLKGVSLALKQRGLRSFFYLLKQRILSPRSLWTWLIALRFVASQNQSSDVRLNH